MKIPSIAELLDSPQLKPWVDRASRNVVVSSVKTFVERMATDLQTRAAEMKVPTVGELAERIAEWMALRRASAPHAQINATGVLLPESASPPLADEALHALSGSLRDYVTDRGHRVEALREIGTLAKQLTGAEASVVTGTHSGALLLALAATCGERPVVVARGQVGEIDPQVTLPQTARCAGVTLRECGIVDRVGPADYEEALPGAGALLIVADPRLSRGGDPLADLEQIAAVARRQQVPVIVDLSYGAIVDMERYLPNVPHAGTALQRGADLVILPGDRLLGGPPCGLILGRQAAIDRLRRHGLFASLAASPLVLLPLAATLELYQDLEVAERAIPLLSLLAASVENLQNRAQRLAPQLASFAQVESATPVEGVARLISGATSPTLHAWQVVVKPQGVTAEALAEQLAATVPSLACMIDNGTLLLNLRTMLPRQDMQVVDALEGLSATSASAASSASSPASNPASEAEDAT